MFAVGCTDVGTASLTDTQSLKLFCLEVGKFWGYQSSSFPLSLLPVPVLWNGQELSVIDTGQENYSRVRGKGEQSVALWAFLRVLSPLTVSGSGLTVPTRWQSETPPFLSQCRAEFQSRLGERGSEVRANPPHLARLGHLTLLPFLARKSLSLRLDSVLIIHFCFGSGEIFMDSDPEDCTASSGEMGVTNTQCFTSSPLPLPPLTLFPSLPAANFLSLKYFTRFKFVPLGFVEFGEGTDWSCSEDTDLSQLPTSGCLLPSRSCQNLYSIPHSPLGAE